MKTTKPAHKKPVRKISGLLLALSLVATGLAATAFVSTANPVSAQALVLEVEDITFGHDPLLTLPQDVLVRHVTTVTNFDDIANFANYELAFTYTGSFAFTDGTDTSDIIDTATWAGERPTDITIRFLDGKDPDTDTDTAAAIAGGYSYTGFVSLRNSSDGSTLGQDLEQVTITYDPTGALTSSSFEFPDFSFGFESDPPGSGTGTDHLDYIALYDTISTDLSLTFTDSLNRGIDGSDHSVRSGPYLLTFTASNLSDADLFWVFGDDEDIVDSEPDGGFEVSIVPSSGELYAIAGTGSPEEAFPPEDVTYGIRENDYTISFDLTAIVTELATGTELARDTARATHTGLDPSNSGSTGGSGPSGSSSTSSTPVSGGSSSSTRPPTRTQTADEEPEATSTANEPASDSGATPTAPTTSSEPSFDPYSAGEHVVVCGFSMFCAY